jgi:thioredoxin-related protein
MLLESILTKLKIFNIMKTVKHLIVLASLLLTSVSFAQVNFISNDWEKTKAEAKQQNKDIYMDCYTDWCIWCKTMDKETFTDNTVADMMNKNFVCIKMDMEKGTGITLAMKYGVSGFPTFLVFNSDGRFLYRSIGYQKPEPFMASLKTALSVTQPVKGYSDKIDLDYPQFYRDVCDGDKTTKAPKEEVVIAYLDKQNDLFSELNWNIMKRFRILGKYKEQFLSNIDKYRDLYGAEEVSDYMDGMISAEVKKAVNDKSDDEFKNALSDLQKNKGKEGESMKQDYELMYYHGTGNCSEYARTAKEIVSNLKETDAGMLNSYSWSIYEICDDAGAIKMATEWMKTAIEKSNTYAYLDTYAALLYKGKDYLMAQKYAQIAIDTGKKEGEKVNETEDLLTKINAALQK